MVSGEGAGWRVWLVWGLRVVSVEGGRVWLVWERRPPSGKGGGRGWGVGVAGK